MKKQLTEVMFEDGHALNFEHIKPFNPNAKEIEKSFMKIIYQFGKPVNFFIDNDHSLRKNSKRVVPQKVLTNKGAVLVSGNQQFEI